MPFAENTIKRYTIALKKLEEAGFEIKEEPEKVVAYLQEKYTKYNTRKSFLSAIYSAYPDNASIPKIYRDAMKKEFELQKVKEESQELTPEQDANYLPWKDIVAVQKQLKDKKDKTSTEWLEYLVVSLYTLTSPVRADYGNMKVVKTSRDRVKFNLFVNINKPHFLFREYKTAGTYGQVKVPVPKPLVNVITEWFEYINQIPEFLLGEKYNPVVLSNFIRRTFKKYTDKSVGINLLRHAYITEYLPTLKTIKKKNEVARRMMHSKDTQELYNLPNKAAESEEEDSKKQD